MEIIFKILVIGLGIPSLILIWGLTIMFIKEIIN